jgi:hypothetical protein
VLARDLRRRHGDHSCLELAESELVRGAGAVEEHAAAGPQPGEEVDLVQQRRVLHDQRVRREDWLVDADGAVVYVTERDDPRVRPPRSSRTPRRAGLR